MSDEKQEKFISKQVKVNGQMITLYSLNGLTWVSDPAGLKELMERLENARVSFNDPKGGANKPKPKERFKPRGPRGAAPTVDGEHTESEYEADSGNDIEDQDIEADESGEDSGDKKSAKSSRHDNEEKHSGKVASIAKKLQKPALPAKHIAPAAKSPKARELTVIAGKGAKKAEKKAPAKAAKPAAKASKASPKKAAKPAKGKKTKK